MVIGSHLRLFSKELYKNFGTFFCKIFPGIYLLVLFVSIQEFKIQIY